MIGVRDMVPWNELRPPGCLCRSWYERDSCCEACDPSEPEPLPRHTLIKIAGPPTVVLLLGALILLFVLLRAHG
jgi:hypothetical protein